MPFLLGLFTNQYPHLRKPAAFTGLILSIGSILLSSWADEVWQLVITQGILQGLGSTLLLSSSTSYVDEWFVSRKAFAYGVILSTKSAIGTAAPFLFGYLLPPLGVGNTLRILTAISGATAIPALYLLRPRLPVIRNSRRQRNLSWRFLTHPTFYLHQAGNIIFAIFYSLPQTYVASFAANVFHFSTSKSALLVAGLNAPAVFGNIWFGFVSDGRPVFRGHWRLSLSTVIMISASGSCLPTLFLWGFASPGSTSGIALVALFVIIYGFFAGGYSSTWGGMVIEMSAEAEAHDEAIDTALVYGLLNAGRGVGWVVGGFAGIGLLNAGSVSKADLAYGSKYGSLILASGIGAALGGVSILLRLRSCWAR
jgi:MFS family permease